jgi:hypothetical protein
LHEFVDEKERIVAIVGILSNFECELRALSIQSLRNNRRHVGVDLIDERRPSSTNARRRVDDHGAEWRQVSERDRQEPGICSKQPGCKDEIVHKVEANI